MENLDFYQMLGAPQGWQCPICKRIYSPTTPMCFYCNGETKTITTSNIDWTKQETITKAKGSNDD